VVLLVAVVLLFVVAAIAALAIDVVTLYTARSEAQLAADGAALAGARVLANSGMTSDPNAVSDGLADNAEQLAVTVATQVAQSNQVGGKSLKDGGIINVSFPISNPLTFGTNPRVQVQVTRTDLPAFFARIWGRNQVTVTATATAEAYNPSGVGATIMGPRPPVAVTCVKPWVLPNISPTDGVSKIFNEVTGAIQDPTLLGWEDSNNTPPYKFLSRCTGTGWPFTPTCNLPNPPGWAGQTPTAWQYYPGAQSSFPAPTQALPSCGFTLTPYQASIAGCVQTPIACNSTVDLDQSDYQLRNTQTVNAVNCLTHALNNQADKVDPGAIPSPPFQFLAGNDNPIVSARGKDVFVSDSLVTVPVYDSNTSAPPSSVTIIGFVQLFLNPDGNAAIPLTTRTTVVNLVGCGTDASGPPVLGNGASVVAVRLVSQ